LVGFSKKKGGEKRKTPAPRLCKKKKGRPLRPGRLKGKKGEKRRAEEHFGSKGEGGGKRNSTRLSLEGEEETKGGGKKTHSGGGKKPSAL